jgi:GNAT superfamily N-acetyltransferase
VSEERIDALAEMARNRGLKLVRSRVRTPGKRRFGKVGLTDKAGKAVFGMDDKGVAAKAEEVEHYLRNLGAQDWGASLDVAVLPRKRKAAKAAREPANDAEPESRPVSKPAREPKSKPEPKPKPPPKPTIRAAKPGHSKVLIGLIRSLGHEIDKKSLQKNLRTLSKAKEPPLVAVLDGRVVGLVGVHKMVAVHRPAPVGRITILVVADEAQDQGIGRMLVEAAEGYFRKAGCKLAEVTSHDRLAKAHAFYRHMGYERTSMRFAKTL